MNAMLATLLNPHADEFRITHVEMIKGIAGQGFYSNMVVPIIENTARECELTDRLREAIAKYPQSNAVLVRRHGVYVWGENWIHAKTQFECYEYLFEAAVKLAGMGIDPGAAPAPPSVQECVQNGQAHEERVADKKRKTAGGSAAALHSNGIGKKNKLPLCIVLDIEGTVAPLSFVADVLFPYAKARLKTFLEETYESLETRGDVELLREQAAADGTTFPASTAPKEEVIAACLANCEAQMAADRKTTALKSLQGHIWRQGYAAGELRTELFRDVYDALAAWRSYGIKTYIYSSGSRLAQRDLFAHTNAGDLRPYLFGFFDTTSGMKIESSSYENIALSLGVDAPSDILFATDNILEARAAVGAGWQAVVVDRPGNKALPAECEFKVIMSMDDLI